MSAKRMLFFLGLIISFMGAGSCFLWAQENKEAVANQVAPLVENKTETAQSPAPAQAPAVPAATPAAVSNAVAAPSTVDTQAPKSTEWVWGEVVSVDADKKLIVIKHLDYETYEEVQTALTIADKTLFENVANLAEIKAGDHLTADFRVASGTNVADLIVVEKEASMGAAAGTETTEEDKGVPTEDQPAPKVAPESPPVANESVQTAQ